jgi:hypothetical protein
LEPFWILKKKNYPSPLGAAFVCWAQPFPLGQTQPLPVGFFYSKNKQNQPTGPQGGKKNKNIRVSHVVSEDPTLITPCLLVVFNKVKKKSLSLGPE